MYLGWPVAKLCVFQRQRQNHWQPCTMSSEPYCTGRWASSYLHQSEFFMWSTNWSYIFKLLNYSSPSTLFPVLSFTFPHLFFPQYLLWQHVISLVFFFLVSIPTTFLFLCPFLFCVFSLSNSVFVGLIVSLLVLFSSCVCLVIRTFP